MGRYKLTDEDVLRRLGTDEATGLTEEEAARRLKLYGPNLVVHHLQVRSLSLALIGRRCGGWDWLAGWAGDAGLGWFVVEVGPWGGGGGGGGAR